MNEANKNTYVFWKNFFKTYPAGQRSMDQLLAMYHDDFQEIWVDGSRYNKNDLRARFSQYLGKSKSLIIDYC